MEKIIDFWLHFGNTVYWIGWLGSMMIWNLSTWQGIAIGVICSFVHLIILQILYWINGDRWFWNP